MKVPWKNENFVETHGVVIWKGINDDPAVRESESP